MTTLASAASDRNERYQRIAMVGQGGMADVWLVAPARGARPPKLFALKELRSGLSEDPDFVSMFFREAKLAVQLDHPNVVRTYEVDFDTERPYLVMEYLEGQPLHALLGRLGRKGGLPLPVHAYVLAQTLAALAYVHDFRDDDGLPLNIVHRDVSPHNVFVGYDGAVKLMDFGIAKIAGGGQTQIGVVKGKVGYMAPEQLLGKPLDRRADVFAVGVMLWEALVGRRLTAGDDAPAVFSKRVQGLQEPVLRLAPDAPPGLAAIADRAMALSPDDRYATAGEMAAAIATWLETSPAGAADLSRAIAGAFAEQRQRVRDLIAQQTGAMRAGMTPSAVLRLNGGEHATGSGVTGSPTATGQSAPAVQLSCPPPEPDAGPSLADLATAEAVRGSPLARLTAGERIALGFFAAVALAFFAGMVLRGASGERPPPTAPALGPLPDRPAAPAAPATPPTAAAHDDVQREVDLIVWAQPEGGRVFVDGEPVGITPLSLRLAQDAGAHVLRVSAPGFRDEERVVSFARDLNIEFSLKPLPRTAAPPPRPTHDPALERTRRPPRSPRSVDDSDPYR